MIKQIIKKIIIIYTALSVIMFSSCESKDENTTDEKGREHIVIACSTEEGLSYDYNERIDVLVNRYNGAAEKFYIEEKKYTSTDNLIMALVGGEHIDIIATDRFMDISPLYVKGVLCDLYEFIDNDDIVSRDTYVNSVLKSVEVGGKLYEMPFDFAVLSAIAKEKLWGDDGDNSFEHLTEKAEALGGIIPYDFSVDSFEFTSYLISEYVDFANGSCSFESEDFKEFIKSLKPYYTKLKNLSFEERENKFKNDEILAKPQYVGIIQQEIIENNVFDKIKYIGLPSKIENYHVAFPTLSFSIPANSENKEGAFDFIKYSTSYDTYIEKSGYEIGIPRMTNNPINKAALDTVCTHYSEVNAGGNPEQIKKYIDETMRQINSINGSGKTICKPISNILSEEMTSYFNGDKDPNEVCRIIQNRVSIYLNEQS